MSRPWICSQIGSREHFTIPAILAENRRLEKLLCDYWSRPGRIWENLPTTTFKKLKERGHPAIPGHRVIDTGMARIFFDLSMRGKDISMWNQILRRNQWYQQWHLKRLNHADTLRQLKQSPGIFFSYSYATGDLFKFFKDLGWKLILGQIDPGKLEEDLVRAESEKFPEYGQNWSPAPPEYWEKWQEEVNMADKIWVNSNWSMEAMAKQKIPIDKVEVLPLAYSSDSATNLSHNYPDTFSPKRPFRLLFLGQINIRKGVHRLLKAMKLIPDAPVELNFVGPMDMTIPGTFKDPRIRFHGSVSRQETQFHFRNSDAFILPTLSDGFAITQLEAQAQQLPLIASKFCAPVVQDGQNGILLKDILPATIADSISHCIANPQKLREWSENSRVGKDYTLSKLRERILAT